MQPQDFDQPPANAGNGLQPPTAPQPLQPAQPGVQTPEPTPQPSGSGFVPNPYNGDGDDNAGNSPRKRTWLIVAGIVLGLICIGCIVALVLAGNAAKDDSNKQATNTATTDTLASPNPQFFFTQTDANLNQVLTYVDAVTGKQTKQILKLNDTITADQPATVLSTNTADMHAPLQMTADGSVIAYATVRQTGAGEGLVEEKTGSFSITAGSRTGDKQPILGGKDAAAILDWVLSANGKYVYYLEGVGNKTEATTAELYSINVATGQAEKLGTVTRHSSRTHSKLFEVTRDRTLRFYSALEDGMYQTTYDFGTEKITRDLITGTNKFFFGSFGDLSPDGKHLMYTGNDTAKNKIVSYHIGVDAGDVQTIFDPADNRVAYTHTDWSPDSKKLLYITTPFSAAGQERPDFPYQLISYDVTSNKQVTLAKTDAPGLPKEGQAASYGAPKWSTDNKYVAYTQGKKLYLYDTAKSSAPTKPVMTVTAGFNDSNTANGWIQLPRTP